MRRYEIAQLEEVSSPEKAPAVLSPRLLGSSPLGLSFSPRIVSEFQRLPYPQLSPAERGQNVRATRQLGERTCSQPFPACRFLWP